MQRSRLLFPQIAVLVWSTAARKLLNHCIAHSIEVNTACSLPVQMVWVREHISTACGMYHLVGEVDAESLWPGNGVTTVQKLQAGRQPVAHSNTLASLIAKINILDDIS